VAVLRGRTQVGDPETSLTVSAGETATIQPGNPPAIAVQETVPTAFDNWSLERDNFEEPRQVAQYVSPQMTGYEDMDRYGSWQPDPTYGNVWIPTEVPTGWAPYHYGHWVWVSPWGWTWVDEAPWGFAPFHYGRWAYVHDHWGWIPGQIAPRPVYAPALVAFIGGAGWSVSIGVGEQPVGWFPLGPQEVYHPGYHVSRDYLRNVNVTNVTNINKAVNVTNNYYNGTPGQNSFANRRFATVVSAKDFAASRPVDKAAISVPAAKLAAAPIATTSAPAVAVDHHAASQNAPHGNFVVGAHGTEHPHTNAVAAPQAPTAPAAATPNANARPEAAQAQHHEEEKPTPTAAPGPPIQHRDRPPGYQPSMRLNTAATAASVATPETHEHVNVPAAPQAPTVQPVHQPETHQVRQQSAAPATQPAQQRPAPHELDIPHPQQAVPLVPSHEGWVRKAPEPAAKPAEIPHVEQPHPAPQAEHSHEAPNDHGTQPNQTGH
jgi:hypothetical protein